MLRLVDITKDYQVANNKVRALKGVSLDFRANEFVSVLGPSGCGKTTLLNIIGGLDKYTTGDLFIKGRSTKEFKDSDWDVYRNHRIGFIFQSYNLIPHQTVLGNVELSLTISGLSKQERVEKAKKALDEVGLQGQYYKRPNQLSGGQSQRVAIARALVNDPEILLADEPTGALDTVTSVQIMDLIKEIAKDRLVIMVTHNPELAEKYSTRIIKLLDGEVQSDSNPYKSTTELVKAPKVTKQSKEVKKQNKETAKMSFWTAFKLSLQNLFTKKARTLLISIAGSIGIIGVSLVLALSYGLQTQIDGMQNDMLSGNPIEVTKTAFDLSALQNSMSFNDKKDIVVENGYVNIDSMVAAIIKRAESVDGIMVNNVITEEYVKFLEQAPEGYMAALVKNYGLDLTNNLYTDVYENINDLPNNMSLATLRTIYTAILKETEYGDYASLISTLGESFMQVPNNPDYINNQYNIIHGTYASKANEMMIVLTTDSMINDLLLAQLGYFTQEEFINLIYKASESSDYDEKLDVTKISYDDLIGKEFVWYPNNDVFKAPTNPLDAYIHNGYNTGDFSEGYKLKITGILQPKEEIRMGSLTSGFYYTEEFANYVLEQNMESNIVKYLRDNDMDSFFGMKQDIEIPMPEPQPPLEVTKDFGVVVNYQYTFEGVTKNTTSYLGKANTMSTLLGSMMGGTGQEILMISINELGGVDIPFSLKIYSDHFEDKELLLTYLDQWNEDKVLVIDGVEYTLEERGKIVYTDGLSLVISMISSLVNIITIALIAFTALSLVVSSFMIAIITYVSVVERTKEIGVIRSLGGRKKDVSRLFNAETFIIGLSSGIVGIFITYVMAIIINLIVKPLIGVTLVILPVDYALIMIAVSIILTVVAGVVPSRSAATKDPVVALRTE